jgi:hypothetical protein
MEPPGGRRTFTEFFGHIPCRGSGGWVTALRPSAARRLSSGATATPAFPSAPQASSASEFTKGTLTRLNVANHDVANHYVANHYVANHYVMEERLNEVTDALFA